MMSALPLEKLVPDYIKRFEAYIPSKPDDELKKMYWLLEALSSE